MHGRSGPHPAYSTLSDLTHRPIHIYYTQDKEEEVLEFYSSLAPLLLFRMSIALRLAKLTRAANVRTLSLAPTLLSGMSAVCLV